MYLIITICEAQMSKMNLIKLKLFESELTFETSIK